MQENTHKDTKSWITILVTIIILALFIIMTSVLLFCRTEKTDEFSAEGCVLVYNENATNIIKGRFSQ